MTLSESLSVALNYLVSDESASGIMKYLGQKQAATLNQISDVLDKKPNDLEGTLNTMDDKGLLRIQENYMSGNSYGPSGLGYQALRRFLQTVN